MSGLQTDYSGWAHHTDASGRAFLANSATGETKWLWNKWALNGRVFCVNAISNDRIWQEDMSPELRIAAGIPPPPPAPPPFEHPKSSSRLAQSPGSAVTATQVAPRHRGHHISSERGFSVEYSSRIKRQRVQHDHFCASCNVYFGSAEALHAHFNSREHAHVAGARHSPRSNGVARVDAETNNGVLRSQDVRHRGPLGSHSLQREAHHYSSTAAPQSARPSSDVRASRFAPATKSISRSPYRQRPASPVAHAISPVRRRSKFEPRSARAKSFVAALSMSYSGLCPKSESVLGRTALLYERDLAGCPSKSSADSLELVDSDTFRSGSAAGAIVGTCDVIEKPFLRLTSAPSPSDVRPLPVLKRALKHVKKMWSKQLTDYEWVCSQLKSIRQDMKVQHIETAEALDTYETHARIALENSDFGEFNTCVAQLTELYTRVDRLDSVRDEFTCYRVLYNVLVGETDSEFAKWLRQTDVSEQSRPATTYAIRVRRAVVEGNYSAFFCLFANPPQRTMVTFLLDHMLDQMRSRALAVMCHAYSPGTIPLSFIVKELVWIDRDIERASVDGESSIVCYRDCNGSVDDDELGSCLVNVSVVLKFCEEIGVVVKSSGRDESIPFVVDAKASKANGVAVLRKRRSLITAAGAQEPQRM